MKNESLFKSDPNSWKNACLIYSEHLNIYSIGYKRAADILIERIKQNEFTFDINTLVFPIVFLYRHYLELILKSIIKEGYAVIGERKNVPEHHNLYKLWNKANELRIKANIEIKNKDRDIVFSCIDDFSKIDPFSEAFRYPTKKKRKGKLETESTLPSDLPYLDLRSFSETINNISKILEHIDSMMHIELDQKREFESEYYGEY
jgi:hypothetical protein